MVTTLRLMIVYLALGQSSCAKTSIAESLLIGGATDIQRYKLSAESRQLSFVVEATFPRMGLPETTWDRLRSDGWRECQSSQREWEAFVDESSNSAGGRTTVFQRLMYWKKEKSLLSIFLRYESGVTVDGQALAEPDNSRQHVIVIADDDLEVERWMELKCD